MLFEQLWQSVEARLSAWLRRWRPLDPVSAARARADGLAAEIEDRQERLEEMKARISALREGAAAVQKEATRLTAQVAECVKAGYESQAWPLVLDLDELNRKLADAQAEVRRHEQFCWSYEFQLRQQRRKLDGIREHLRRLGPPHLR